MNDHSAPQPPAGSQSLSPETPASNIVVFGFDVAEISQIRRIRALRSLGHSVQSFTMRRANMNLDFTPDWPNTHLYNAENEKILKRAFVVAGSIVKMTRHRQAIQAADMIMARNLDMLAIAWAARRLARAQDVPLVYECLDIHDAMTGDGAKSAAMRRAEKFLLADCAVLAVSSPGFLRNYFEPVQGFTGTSVLLENKLALGAATPPRPGLSARPAGTALRLGWVGTIRCRPSFDILLETARRMGDALEVNIHGVVHRHVLPDFDARIAEAPNVRYHGPYDYPADLPAVYAGCDLVWSQDLWQRGRNSDWLLPNRIYEASWAGCPSLAVAGTETGRRIEEDGLGWTIPEPSSAALSGFLTTLPRAAIETRRADILQMPQEAFVQTDSDMQTVIDLALAAGQTARRRAA
ncbi:glycosyl transferase (plasmid) [Salipiger sp. H15]|uniref:Glycosyl transferase n=1 Tax=Alloyangia sp. H15 TaxID=3029062 RepID=A0AAU8AQ65_9RHOB